MFETELAKAGSLLKISLAGRVAAEEVKGCAEQVQRLLPDTQPGFALLTDLSRLEAMGLDCVPHLKSFMELCNKAGVGMVVRVIPDPHKDIGFSILSVFHYRRRVKIVTCKTMEEAQRALDSDTGGAHPLVLG
jgi:anti-anti-sigma regulatory factor